MFENLLGQDVVAASLSRALSTDRMPGAALFSGPRFSGKRTAALEVARSRSCLESAAWNCPCSSCVRHRPLLHADLLLFGPVSSPREIDSIAELVSASDRPSEASLFMLARSVRSVLARFNPALYSGEEGKLAKSAQSVLDAEDMLEAVMSGDLDAPRSRDLATKLRECVAKLAQSAGSFIPVFQVRNAENWARLSPSGKAKTVIVENAERMQESSRNALLKVLEEPPARCSFILLSARKTALPRTVLSRLRDYRFDAPGPSRHATVLGRVFKVEGYSSLGEFFEKDASPSSATMASLAKEFLAAAIVSERGVPAAGDPFGPLVEGTRRMSLEESTAITLKETSEFGTKDSAREGSFNRFLRALCAETGRVLPSGDGSAIRVAESWNRSIREAETAVSSWNQSPSLALERLAAELRSAL